MKELLSRTDEEHPDYDNIKASITAVEKQINSVNKRIRQSQATNEVVAIGEKLVGDDVPVSLLFFLHYNEFISLFLMKLELGFSK